MSQTIDALVVGAGPTGLTMAGELARHGLSVRLIDKAEKPPLDHSRALAVQARTLEIFEQMGITDQILARGHKTAATNVLLPGGRRARLPLTEFEALCTPFPGLYMVQQSDTEAVLASRLPDLGVSLERGVSLASYKQDDTGVSSTLQKSDGTTEEVF